MLRNKIIVFKEKCQRSQIKRQREDTIEENPCSSQPLLPLVTVDIKTIL